MAVGKTNAAAGAGAPSFVSASTSGTIKLQSSSTTYSYLYLTCDFDPLFVFVSGPDWYSTKGGCSMMYRLSADSAWPSRLPPNQTAPLSINGRSISAGWTNDTFSCTAYVYAWGFPD